MKKIITVGIITILTTLTLAGCKWFKPAEPPVTEETVEIVKAADYRYDKETGELKSLKDNKVLYTHEYKREGYPVMVLYILGLEGTKLIVWETTSEDSPGPGWKHEVWFNELAAKNIYYLDLDNSNKGLQPYTVPESKKQEEGKLFEEFIEELERSIRETQYDQ